MRTERVFGNGPNYYVPAAQAVGLLGQSLRGRFSFGAPIVTDPDLILDGVAVTSAVDTTDLDDVGFTQSEAQMGKYGRNLVIVSTAGNTTVATVYGRDYLGQKMRENFTLNEATPVVGVKAFRYVDRVVLAASAGDTVDLGVGTKFGLPYATIKVNAEWSDKVLASAGTLTAAVFTDPQTAITGDPRGLYVPNTTPNGSRVIDVDIEYTTDVNAAGNGGAHGIQHFNG